MVKILPRKSLNLPGPADLYGVLVGASDWTSVQIAAPTVLFEHSIVHFHFDDYFVLASIHFGHLIANPDWLSVQIGTPDWSSGQIGTPDWSSVLVAILVVQIGTLGWLYVQIGTPGWYYGRFGGPGWSSGPVDGPGPIRSPKFAFLAPIVVAMVLRGP